MPDREQQIPAPPSRAGIRAAPAETVTAAVVSAASRRAHDPAIAERLRHGLLRTPLRPGGAPRW